MPKGTVTKLLTLDRSKAEYQELLRDLHVRSGGMAGWGRVNNNRVIALFMFGSKIHMWREGWKEPRILTNTDSAELIKLSDNELLNYTIDVEGGVKADEKASKAQPYREKLTLTKINLHHSEAFVSPIT